MASASPLMDIEDSYFECSYCLQNFKEPKLLPCVHRFCRNCLSEIIGTLVANFNCPLCNHQCAIPPNGADGFRTDFHMESLLQYLQLHHSAKTGEIKECASCSKEAKITSFCFKCKAFLCDQCNQIHMTLQMMQEHKSSVVSLKDIRERRLTSEKLSALTESPMCHAHLNKVADVCCESCNNLPICRSCGHYGEHKSHELYNIRSLARQEREKMERTLATLEEYTANLQQLPIRVDEAKKKLRENISNSKEKLQMQYTKETEKIKRQLQEIDDMLEMNKAEIDEIEKQELMELEKERKKEIESAVEVNIDKCDKLIREKEATSRNMRDFQVALYGEKRAKVNRKLAIIDKDFNDLCTSVDIQDDQNSEKIRKISNDANNRKKRFDNFRSTASCTLASNNDWTHVQCLPNINTASDALIRDVQRNYPELESLTHITVSDLSSFTADTVSITEQSVIDIDGIGDCTGLKIYNMTTTDAGIIIVTGGIDDQHNHITVINRQGKVVRQNRYENVVTIGPNRQWHCRTCSDMSLFRVATTTRDREVGIYDTRNGTYIKKDMSDITNSWEQGQSVTCVATDRNNKNIFVGSDSRNVVILDDKLNYRRTLHLPEMIVMSHDISLHDDNLLVCDSVSGSACIVTTKETGAELVRELLKPDHGGSNWDPFRVCTDSSGFIYILWRAMIAGQIGRIILTQHSQDGRKLLITKPVDVKTVDITTFITDGAEKLLLATYGTCKMCISGLETH